MANYQGIATSYDLAIESPNVHTNYKRVIHLKGDFGIAFLYFVPSGNQLGENHKRPGGGTALFDIYYWDTEWDGMVDMLRNEGPVWFFYEDVRNTAVVKTSDEAVGEAERAAAE